MNRAKRGGVTVGVLVGLGVAGWLVVDRATPPEVDPALAAAVLPMIDEELEKGRAHGLLETVRPELGPRWFCVELVIEIRRTGDELAVGIEALCDEYAREGKGMLLGSGEGGPKVVVLVAEAGGYRVSGVEHAPDGTAFARWMAENFSEDGAIELDRRSLPGESTAEQARRAFGLSADAPVRHQTQCPAWRETPAVSWGRCPRR